MATQPQTQRIPSTEPEPLPNSRPAYTLSQRTVSGLDHDISALVKELEQLGLDITARARK